MAFGLEDLRVVVGPSRGNEFIGVRKSEMTWQHIISTWLSSQSLIQRIYSLKEKQLDLSQVARKVPAMPSSQSVPGDAEMLAF